MFPLSLHLCTPALLPSRQHITTRENIAKQTTHLDDDGALIESERDIIALPAVGDAPRALEAIIEGILEAVGRGMPNFDRAVFGSGHEDRQGRVKDGERDVRGVPLEGLDARL